MATDLLAARQAGSARLGHILVIEGCDYAFTDVVSLAGSSYVTGRTILSGLGMPKSIKLGCNIREGLLKEFSTTFTVLDDGHNGPGNVASLFRATFDDANADRIYDAIPATTTTVGATLTGANATTVNPRGRHIGVERISTTGGRRDYFIHPGTAPSPFEHSWRGGETSQDELVPLEVTDEIRVWAGRRVGLHQLVYDDAAGSWRTWSDQFSSGSLIWTGTMQGRGEIVGASKFKIVCDGPASITRRLLNRTRSYKPRAIVPRMTLADAQKGVAVAFQRREAVDFGNAFWRSTIFDDGNDITATSNDALQTELNSIIDAAAAGTNYNYDGSGVLAADNFGDTASAGSVNVTSGGISIKFTDVSVDVYMARAIVVMHEKAWALLGFDPTTQAALDKSADAYNNFYPFEPGQNLHGFNWEQKRGAATPVLDFDGYWVLEVQTQDQDPAHQWDNNPDNNGLIRLHAVLWPGGTSSIEPGARQEIALAVGDQVHVPGQLATPPAPSYLPAEVRPEIDLATVDAMGWFLLTGKIARGASQFDDVDFEDFAQVARCAWVNASGGIDLDSNGLNAALVIESFEDPRAFGLPYEKLKAPWLSGGTNQITATPMAWFGGYRGWQGSIETRPDLAWRIITRTLLSSGTATGWGSTGDPVTYLTPGVNAPSVSQPSDQLGSDTEIADLGLGLEADQVNFDSFRELHEDTLGQTTNPLGLVVAAYARPVQSEELLGSLLQGRGWSFAWLRRPGYKQPRWTGVDFFSTFGADDVQVLTGDAILHITDSDIAGRVEDVSSWVPRVDQKWRSPIDRFKVESRGEVIGDSLTHDASFLPQDKGASRRHGATVLNVRDETLSNPRLFSFEGDEKDFQWDAAFLTRWARDVSGFLALPNRVVTLNVTAPKGQWLYPGQAFLLSNSAINSLDGQTIGVTSAQCRVLSTEIHTSGTRAGSYTVEALMIGVDTSGSGGFPTIWAGSARVLTTVDNGGSSYTFTCDADWLDAGHGGNDISGFEEPDWSAIGGDTEVLIRQSFDLVNFPSANHVTATVSSVTTGTNTLVVTGASGTVYESTFKIITLAAYTDQPSGNWVRGLVAMHTDGSGVSHTSGTQGKKLG